MNVGNPKVLFYEWSNVNSTPIGFNTVEDFINFCQNSNIKLSKKNINFLNNKGVVFMVCKPNNNELVMSGDYRNLRKNFSKHYNNQLKRG